MQVTGPLGSVAVTQHFSNPFEDRADFQYLFPLPETAAIIDFELQIGKRHIKSSLQEVEQAREIYKRSRTEGKHAGLFEERRPNLFSIDIANVMPGESILAVMRYQERLIYDNHHYSFVFPMGLTPKYHSPSNLDEGKGLDAPIAIPGEQIGPVDINLSIDAGVPCGDPISPSHKIKVTRLDERRITCQLDEKAIPDHDFVLRYPLLVNQTAMAAWMSHGENGINFLATLLPPVDDYEITETPAREFIFVLDRSGSMSGEPIKQARNALRACLRTLNPQDRFMLILFDDQLEWYKTEPAQVTQSEIQLTDNYLSMIEGRGGTEIVAALQAALKLPRDPDYLRYIIFLTDGAVSAEKRAFDQVKQEIGDARLFTFGIGPSVNRALLNKLAQLGKGKAEFLQLDEDIEDAILRFQDRISFPVLTGISLKWENGQARDVYPANLPDLFAGQPLEIVGRLKPGRSGTVLLTVSGRIGQNQTSFSLSLPEATTFEPAINRAWARARIDDLLESGAAEMKPVHQVRNEVIKLAIEQRLVTPFTAFIAVDELPVVNEGKSPRKIHVSQPLPEGLDMQGFLGGVIPVNALSATPPSPSRMAVHDSVISIVENSMMQPINSEPLGNRSKRKDSIPLSSHHLKLSEPINKSEVDSYPATADDLLHWLARTQEVNGSWKDDAEYTSAALLVFLRAGFTTRKGYYRRQIRRAAQWLTRFCTTHPAGFLCAAVLTELAQVTPNSGFSETARNVIANLSEAGTPVEKAIKAHLDGPGQPAPAAIHNFEDLKIAAIINLSLPVPEELLTNDLAKIYAACISG